jgi:6-phosphofructokinase 2
MADGIPRIVTLTINPALDIATEAKAVRPTHKIRTSGEHFDPGGGGINVSRVVHALGASTLALLATGGASGRMIEEMLTQAGVAWKSTPLHGSNRICLTVRDRSTDLEYRFVPEGPAFEPSEWNAVLAGLEIGAGDWLVGSGSLPPGVPVDFYAQVARAAAARGARFALDTSGPALRAAVSQGIDILKVSLGECESIVDRELRDLDAQGSHAMALVRSGAAGMIALTLGRNGAILATSDGALWLPAVEIVEHSAVGAGDSFLAGLVLGLARGQGPADSLRLASAAGAAAASSIGTARVRSAEVEAMLERMDRPEFLPLRPG